MLSEEPGYGLGFKRQVCDMIVGVASAPLRRGRLAPVGGSERLMALFKHRRRWAGAGNWR